jgi:hypothetical protein
MTSKTYKLLLSDTATNPQMEPMQIDGHSQQLLNVSTTKRALDNADGEHQSLKRPKLASLHSVEGSLSDFAKAAFKVTELLLDRGEPNLLGLNNLNSYVTS